jgi:hypothetical protein
MGQYSWEITFKSRVKGPIESGKMEIWAAQYSHDAASAIADSAKDTWLNYLHSSIRHQTPFYTTQIDKREITPTLYEIHDSDVIYGAWLESGAYTPRRAFAGYHAQERAKATVRAKRSTIARRILRRYRASGKLI